MWLEFRRVLFRSIRQPNTTGRLYNFDMGVALGNTVAGTKIDGISPSSATYKSPQEVYRRFNPIGFLEYEEKKPYKTKVGYYDITEITVLSKKDDMFISHFE